MMKSANRSVRRLAEAVAAGAAVVGIVIGAAAITASPAAANADLTRADGTPPHLCFEAGPVCKPWSGGRSH